MIWAIPAEPVKQNKDGERTHKVPITQNMVILLDELRAAFGYLNSKYVFPSTTTNKSGPGEQPIDRHSLSRSISRKLEQLIGSTKICTSRFTQNRSNSLR